MPSHSPNDLTLRSSFLLKVKNLFFFCSIFILPIVTITKLRVKRDEKVLSLLTELMCHIRISKNILSLDECYHQC